MFFLLLIRHLSNIQEYIMVWITTNLIFSAMLRKICNTVEAYLELSRTFSIELFVEIVRGFLLLTIFAKNVHHICV